MIEVHRIHFAGEDHALLKFAQAFLHSHTRMFQESFCKRFGKRTVLQYGICCFKHLQEGLGSPQKRLPFQGLHGGLMHRSEEPVSLS